LAPESTLDASWQSTEASLVQSHFSPALRSVQVSWKFQKSTKILTR